MPGRRSALTRAPSSESSAGISVMAARTATNTTIADVYPSVVTIGMPDSASESRAMITVKPANSTAPPDVAVVRAIDSEISMPARSWSRWRLTTNRP